MTRNLFVLEWNTRPISENDRLHINNVGSVNQKIVRQIVNNEEINKDWLFIGIFDTFDDALQYGNKLIERCRLCKTLPSIVEPRMRRITELLESIDDDKRFAVKL